MNIKQILMSAILAAITIVSVSCGKNDYSPIYLVDADTQTPIEGNRLTLNIFSESNKYLIRGGKGNYTISVADRNVADFRYDGDTLVYLPVSAGTTESIIADRSGNSYVLNVNVGNPQSVYTIKKIEASIEGDDDLTLGDIKEMEASIIQESPAGEGGRFEFTYADENYSSGDIKIYPEATGSYQVGIFTASRKQDMDTEKEVLYIKAVMAGTNETYTFIVTFGSPEGNYIFQEEVTDRYKGEYPELTKAYRIYQLQKQ